MPVRINVLSTPSHPGHEIIISGDGVTIDGKPIKTRSDIPKDLPKEAVTLILNELE